MEINRGKEVSLATYIPFSSSDHGKKGRVYLEFQLGRGVESDRGCDDDQRCHSAPGAERNSTSGGQSWVEIAVVKPVRTTYAVLSEQKHGYQKPVSEEDE